MYGVLLQPIISVKTSIKFLMSEPTKARYGNSRLLMLFDVAKEL